MKGLTRSKSAGSRASAGRIDSLLWADTMLETSGARYGEGESGGRRLHRRPVSATAGSVASRGRRC